MAAQRHAAAASGPPAGEFRGARRVHMRPARAESTTAAGSRTHTVCHDVVASTTTMRLLDTPRQGQIQGHTPSTTRRTHGNPRRTAGCARNADSNAHAPRGLRECCLPLRAPRALHASSRSRHNMPWFARRTSPTTSPTAASKLCENFAKLAKPKLKPPLSSLTGNHPEAWGHQRRPHITTHTGTPQVGHSPLRRTYARVSHPAGPPQIELSRTRPSTLVATPFPAATVRRAEFERSSKPTPAAAPMILLPPCRACPQDASCGIWETLRVALVVSH